MGFRQRDRNLLSLVTRFTRDCCLLSEVPMDIRDIIYLLCNNRCYLVRLISDFIRLYFNRFNDVRWLDSFGGHPARYQDGFVNRAFVVNRIFRILYYVAGQSFWGSLERPIQLEHSCWDNLYVSTSFNATCIQTTGWRVNQGPRSSEFRVVQWYSKDNWD